MNCEPPYLRVALQLTLICQGPTSRVFFKGPPCVATCPWKHLDWSLPVPAESGLSSAPAALVGGSSKHGLGHCRRSPPRSTSPGFLFDHFLGLGNGKTQTCSALCRVSTTTSLFFSCHLTLLAGVPRAQPKSERGSGDLWACSQGLGPMEN